MSIVNLYEPVIEIALKSPIILFPENAAELLSLEAGFERRRVAEV